MPGPRTALVVALAVGFALVAVGVQALGVLLHSPVDHGAWRTGAVAVVLVGVWWLVNSPVEGPVLLTVSSEHGFTLADLFGVPVLAVGAAVLVQVVRGG